MSEGLPGEKGVEVLLFCSEGVRGLFYICKGLVRVLWVEKHPGPGDPKI